MENESKDGWVLRCDGSCKSNPGDMGAGWALYRGERVVTRGSEYLGQGTNNVAEYRALICGLRAISNFVSDYEPLTVCMDSKLVITQMRGEAKVEAEHLLPLHAEAMSVSGVWPHIRFEQVPRMQNLAADHLATKAVLLATQRQKAEGTIETLRREKFELRTDGKTLWVNPGGKLSAQQAAAVRTLKIPMMEVLLEQEYTGLMARLRRLEDAGQTTSPEYHEKYRRMEETDLLLQAAHDHAGGQE